MQESNPNTANPSGCAFTGAATFQRPPLNHDGPVRAYRFPATGLVESLCERHADFYSDGLTQPAPADDDLTILAGFVDAAGMVGVTRRQISVGLLGRRQPASYVDDLIRRLFVLGRYEMINGAIVASRYYAGPATPDAAMNLDDLVVRPWGVGGVSVHWTDGGGALLRLAADDVDTFAARLVRAASGPEVDALAAQGGKVAPDLVDASAVYSAAPDPWAHSVPSDPPAVDDHGYDVDPVVSFRRDLQPWLAVPPIGPLIPCHGVATDRIEAYRSAGGLAHGTLDWSVDSCVFHAQAHAERVRVGVSPSGRMYGAVYMMPGFLIDRQSTQCGSSWSYAGSLTDGWNTPDEVRLTLGRTQGGDR